jgi:hypothetical protein
MSKLPARSNRIAWFKALSRLRPIGAHLDSTIARMAFDQRECSLMGQRMVAVTGTEAMAEVSDVDDEIEFEIQRLPGARFHAKLHLFRRGRWWPSETRICASELEAMRWINGRLAIRGFEEPYDLEANAVLPRSHVVNLGSTTALTLLGSGRFNGG